MKPILFNTEMVRAILEGRKTVTRRVVKLPKRVQEQENGLYTLFTEGTVYENFCIEQIVDYISPYQVGDILYVRETWQSWSCAECDEECTPDNGSGCCTMPKYLYKASHDETYKGWKPSIHMPKEAARIFLRVTDVRVERLQDITEAEAEKEGCKAGYFEYKGAVWGQEDTEEWTAIDDFSNVWQSTIKRDQFDIYGWNANPYVWVIEFERIEKPAAVFN